MSYFKIKLKIRKQIIFNVCFDHSIYAYSRENENKKRNVDSQKVDRVYSSHL